MATYGPLIRECDPSLVQGTYLTNKQIILRKWEADQEFVEIITEIEKVHKILSPTHLPAKKKKKKRQQINLQLLYFPISPHPKYVLMS